MMIGKIYKIIHTQSNIIYVGSTFDELRNRFRKHKINLGCSISKYIQKYGKEQFKIILIKEYNVIDRKHLEAYEQLWINKLNCINKKQTFRPLEKQFEKIRFSKMDLTKYKKEWYEKNKDRLQEKMKENYIKNKDKRQEKINCICGSQYSFQHKLRHEKSEKHSHFMRSTPQVSDCVAVGVESPRLCASILEPIGGSFINKIKPIEKKATDKILCECGVLYSRSNKNVHLKSKKHLLNNYLHN